ncbi:DUF397 domain-containing protein [Actinoallomurus soli]|uniref:DUF397 domain-containing protein n=1 Tax=Actinoallomurus soli TaxID=2952535 RepID=UPI002093F458|nr:DUF397 domain-containing protein [Actinoallomurus soli]MCO5973627.1 DUF397 domain-containing protein [Actinoallomurus soli]
MDEVSGTLGLFFVDGEDVPVKHKVAARMVVLRDSVTSEGTSLYYTPDEWQAFVLGVKDGEFDDMTAVPVSPQEGELVVAIRDSKDPDGPKLFVSVKAWSELLDRIKAGECELPQDMYEMLDERFR